MKLFPSTTAERERDIRWLFDASLILKLFNGSLEIITALLILIVPPSFVLRLVEAVTAGELSRDPNDVVATTILNAAHAFAVHPHYFLSLYLVLHGVVKIALVVGIFAKKRIAYPLFMISLVVFGTYEGYLGFTKPNVLLQLFSAMDFIVILLTLHEYRRRYPDNTLVPGRKDVVNA